MVLATARALAALLIVFSLSTAPSAQVMNPQTGEPVPLGISAPPETPTAERGGGEYLIPIQHITAGTTKLVRTIPTAAFGNLVVYEDGAALLLGTVAIPVGRGGGAPVFQEFDRVTLPGLPTDAVVVGDRLFVTLGKAPGLIEYVISVTDGEDPTLEEVNRADFPNAFAVTDYGDRLYVGRGTAGVSILNLADLASLGSFDTPGSANGLAASVLDFGVLVLVVADGNVSTGDDVRIYDVTDAAAPTLLSSAETNGFATYAVVQNDATVFVTGAAGLTAISLFDGSVLGVVEAGGTTYEIAFDDPGDSVFYVNGLGGTRAIDVSDPANMTVVASNDFGGQGLSLALGTDFVLAADRFGGVRLLDKVSLNGEGRFENGGFAHKPYVDTSTDRLFVTDLAGRIRAFSLNGGGEPVEEVLDARLTVPSNTQEILTTIGGFGFVSHRSGVSVIDVSGAVPVPITEVNLGQQAFGMALLGDVLYVANGFGGLVALDVSNPAAPTTLSSTPVGSNLVGVALDPSGADVVYAASFGGGMFAYDVSDPAAPVQLDAEPTFGFLNALTTSPDAGPLAFVADGQAGLRVVDISDPADLVSLATAPTSTQARDVSTGVFTNDGSNDTSVAVADDFFGVRLFAFDDGTISIRGAAETADRGIGVTTWTPQIVTDRIAGVTPPDVVIVAAGEAGIYLYQAEVAVAGERGADDADLAVGVWPNPARGAATLSVTLPTTADVEVSIYDALGRRVATVARQLAAGPQQVALETSGWAPGVYVARVQAGDATATTRLTVLR